MVCRWTPLGLLMCAAAVSQALPSPPSRAPIVQRQGWTHGAIERASRSVFEVMDADHSGTMQLSELHAAILLLYLKINKAIGRHRLACRSSRTRSLSCGCRRTGPSGVLHPESSRRMVAPSPIRRVLLNSIHLCLRAGRFVRSDPSPNRSLLLVARARSLSGRQGQRTVTCRALHAARPVRQESERCARRGRVRGARGNATRQPRRARPRAGVTHVRARALWRRTAVVVVVKSSESLCSTSSLGSCSCRTARSGSCAPRAGAARSMRSATA